MTHWTNEGAQCAPALTDVTSIALISGLADQREPGYATQPFAFASSESTNTPTAETGLRNEMFGGEEEGNVPDARRPR